jgi:hypothetical protein
MVHVLRWLLLSTEEYQLEGFIVNLKCPHYLEAIFIACHNDSLAGEPILELAESAMRYLQLPCKLFEFLAVRLKHKYIDFLLLEKLTLLDHGHSLLLVIFELQGSFGEGRVSPCGRWSSENCSSST